MPRKRDDDEDDRDDEDRPRSGRKRRDDDDDDYDDDRPRRKRRSRDDDDDDYDDRPLRRKKALTGLDAMYHDTSIVILVLFGCLCGWIAVILSVVALITCKDPTAKRNATIVIVVAFVVGVLHTVSFIMRSGGAGAARF